MNLALEFDAVFIEGIGVTLASIIVFCGSVFLLLTFILGPRLAYFVTASVTLAFLLIMGLIWSTAQLGPVGKLPEWDITDIAEEGETLDVPQADALSFDEGAEGPWRAVDPEDPAQVTKAGELGSDAVDALTDAAESGEVPREAGGNLADTDTVRLLEEDGTEYGAVLITPPEGEDVPNFSVAMRYDPGDPLGPPRMITAGTFLLLVGHLFALSFSERKAKQRQEATA